MSEGNAPLCPVCNDTGHWMPELKYSMPLECNCLRMAPDELAEFREMVSAMVDGVREMVG